MVCIIDDREDVWNFSPNLIHVKPYRFFQGTADINAPPGLDKTEHDKEPLTHKVHVVSRSNSKEDETEGEEKEGNEEQKPKAAINETTQNESESKEESEKETEELNGKEDSKKETKDESNISEDSEKKTDVDETKDRIEEGKKAKKSSSKGKEENDKDSKGIEKSDSEKHKKEVENGSKSAEEKEGAKTEDLKKEEVEIEWDDDDDYLLYLEDILVTVHKAFYDMYDQLKSKGEDAEKPDMKNILPYVKRKVLKGTNLLFSGVFPMNVPLEKSQAYHVAKMLGANVHTDFVAREKDGSNKSEYTTHVVAARQGTIKVKLAQKHRHVKLVNPQWLWTCAERLQHVDERLYPLNDSTSGNLYCESPDTVRLNRKRKNEEESEIGKRQRQNEDEEKSAAEEEMEVSDIQKIEAGKSEEGPSAAKIGSSRFSTTYNPMLAFSDEDLECMDKEVEDFMDEEGDESEEDDIDRNERIRLSVLSSGDDDDDGGSSEDSMSGEFPRGWNLKKRLRSSKSADSTSDNEEQKDRRDEESENELEKYEKTMAAFAPDTESETQDSFAESIGSVDDEMAEAVEREFLAN